MTQPTAEASDDFADEVRAAHRAGLAEGRRLEAARLAPLVEAIKAWRDRVSELSSTLALPWERNLRAAHLALVAAFDALTREDTEPP